MENYQNSLQDERLNKIEKSMNIINHEMGAVSADLLWLKWQSRIVIAGMIGVLFKLFIG